MSEVHNILTKSAHGGHAKTFNRIASTFYWPKMSRAIQRCLYSRVCGLVDGVGKVFEDAPDPISEVEVDRVEIMNFGDDVYMMVFQSRGKERGFEDATEYAGVRNGIERYYIQR